MSGVSGEALTIGEVIGRLAADFPDLTVSKIRYLESGGLISPGRTPAGYRRFTEEDVEKLRWVLAAQRDQYLPLKVIRQHLAADGPRVSLGDADAIVAALTAGADEGAESDPDVRATADRAGAGGQTTASRAGSAWDPAAQGQERGQPQDQAQDQDQAASQSQSQSDSGAHSQNPADGPALPPTATLTPPLPPLPHPRSRAATVSDPEFYFAARSDVGELHLSREALARTAGVSESFLADLVDYGLLPNTEAFGGDAVFIARSASTLAEYGLEPRHLRPLMTSARNTAGLLGTLLPARRHDGVTGTARQAAATRAASRTAEASAAVVKLYGALLRAELAAEAAPGALGAQHAPVPQPAPVPHPVPHAAPAPLPAPVPHAAPVSHAAPAAQTQPRHQPRQIPPATAPRTPTPPAPAPPAPPHHAPSAPADTSPATSAPASRESSRNPGMPGGPAAR